MIGEYNWHQAVTDGLAVPIHIESLTISPTIEEEREQLSREFDEIAEGPEVIDRKAWFRLKDLAGAQNRLHALAHYIVTHFESS